MFPVHTDLEKPATSEGRSDIQRGPCKEDGPRVHGMGGGPGDGGRPASGPADRVPALPAWLQMDEVMGLGDELPEETLDAVISAQQPNQCCVLIYTSGTTGSPKGVMLSQDNVGRGPDGWARLPVDVALAPQLRGPGDLGQPVGLRPARTEPSKGEEGGRGGLSWELPAEMSPK